MRICAESRIFKRADLFAGCGKKGTDRTGFYDSKLLIKWEEGRCTIFKHTKAILHSVYIVESRSQMREFEKMGAKLAEVGETDPIWYLSSE